MAVSPHTLAGVQTAFKGTGTTAATSTDTAALQPLGYHTALIAEASDARSSTSLLVDGASGDTDFPHGNLKAITVGEYDRPPDTCLGVPDGMGDAQTPTVSAYLAGGVVRLHRAVPVVSDEGQLRLTAFTGSHLHADYDRTIMSTFMNTTTRPGDGGGRG